MLLLSGVRRHGERAPSGQRGGGSGVLVTISLRAGAECVLAYRHSRPPRRRNVREVLDSQTTLRKTFFVPPSPSRPSQPLPSLPASLPPPPHTSHNNRHTLSRLMILTKSKLAVRGSRPSSPHALTPFPFFYPPCPFRRGQSWH